MSSTINNLITLTSRGLGNITFCLSLSFVTYLFGASINKPTNTTILSKPSFKISYQKAPTAVDGGKSNKKT